MGINLCIPWLLESLAHAPPAGETNRTESVRRPAGPGGAGYGWPSSDFIDSSSPITSSTTSSESRLCSIFCTSAAERPATSPNCCPTSSARGSYKDCPELRRKNHWPTTQRSAPQRGQRLLPSGCESGTYKAAWQKGQRLRFPVMVLVNAQASHHCQQSCCRTPEWAAAASNGDCRPRFIAQDEMALAQA